MTALAKSVLIIIIVLMAGIAGYFLFRNPPSLSNPAPSNPAAANETFPAATTSAHQGAAAPSATATAPTKPKTKSSTYSYSTSNLPFPNLTQSPDPSSVSKGPVIITAFLTDGKAGENYNIFVSAAGGGKTYGWKIVSGKLPPGLKAAQSINCAEIKETFCRPSYQISGAPETAGIFNFRVAVSDGTQAVYKDYSLKIMPASNLKITTTSLPEATIIIPYQAEITGFGGNYYYSWNLADGKLPPGLELTSTICTPTPCAAVAKITGKPQVSGTYNFVISLASGSDTVKKEFSITVK